MFCYIKARKKGTLDWKAVREDGRIMVFDRYEPARSYADSMQDSVCKIVKLLYHPMDKRSPIYRKRYKKSGWE
ncbi:hypothetical protein KY361_04120 [Candidatus Woesearchaeota archaeon]|nr:hypothetical protein [Candidatus Woesearchaeota archaeon]